MEELYALLGRMCFFNQEAQEIWVDSELVIGLHLGLIVHSLFL
jgi:hypothetical protein